MINTNEITDREGLIRAAATRHGCGYTESFATMKSAGRVQTQARRSSILAGDPSELIATKIAYTFSDLDIKRRILPFVSVAINAGLDMTQAIACTYKQEVGRSLAGAGDKAEAAFDQINFESKLQALAPGVNRSGWFVGPVLEWPRVVEGRLERVFFSSERYEVWLNPLDMLGEPQAYAFPWLEGDESLVVVSDADGYHYYKVGDHDIELRRTDRHDANAQTCTAWRWEKPQDPSDWWVHNRHQRIVDGTISAGYSFAILEWVRKNQNRPFWYFFANQEKVIKGQTIDPARPFIHHVKGEDQVPNVGTLDLTADVGQFVEHIRFILQALIEGYGIPPSALTFSIGESGLPAAAIEMSTDRMHAIRQEQIPWARAAEWSSAWRAIAVCKGMGHKLADDLPAPEFVRESKPGQGLKLDWPELTRADDPKEKREQKKYLIGRGHWNDVDEELARHPELADDRAAAKARLVERIKEQKEIDAEKADTPKGGLGADLETDAEQTGAMGPEIRDQEDPPGDTGQEENNDD